MPGSSPGMTGYWLISKSEVKTNHFLSNFLNTPSN
jgi:hypothetical protein